VNKFSCIKLEIPPYFSTFSRQIYDNNFIYYSIYAHELAVSSLSHHFFETKGFLSWTKFVSETYTSDGFSHDKIVQPGNYKFRATISKINTLYINYMACNFLGQQNYHCRSFTDAGQLICETRQN